MLRRKWFSVFILMALLGALVPGRALAVDVPDNLLIESALAYSGVLESGDMVVIVRYDIDYASIPTEVVSETFVGRFMRGTSELNATEILNFQNGGYGQGIFSFYFTASDMTTQSIEYGDTNNEGYTVVLQGKPTAFAVPPTVNSVTITYRNSAITKQILNSDTIQLARVLQDDSIWSGNGIQLIDFATGRQVLTTDGQSYFGQAVPNMQIMVPDLFGSSVTGITPNERDFTFSERDRLQSFWDGRGIDDSFQAGADLFDTSKLTFTTVALALPLIVGIIVFGTAISGSPEFGIATAALTVPMVTRIGLMSMTFAFVVGLLCAVALGFAYFLRRA